MRKYTPPEFCKSIYPRSVFLAGSIDNGEAEDWQSRAEGLLERSNITVFNPRRPDWDWTWEQSITNEKFVEQVSWEHEHLMKADRVIFNFLSGSKSPVTMLEFGLMAGQRAKRCIVICPEGFWRKGNVDIICNFYKIKQVNTLEEAIELVK